MAVLAVISGVSVACGESAVDKCVKEVAGVRKESGANTDLDSLRRTCEQMKAASEENDQAGAPRSAAPQSQRAVPVPSPAPTSPRSTIASDSELQWRFQSKTGNIACDLNGSTSPPEAICEIRDHSYTPQVKPNCAWGWVNSFRLQQGQPVATNCYPSANFPNNLPVQDYGTPLTVGSLTCVIDENTGVTCKDSTTGHFFQAARQAYQWR
jgi:hypothetical protein